LVGFVIAMDSYKYRTFVKMGMADKAQMINPKLEYRSTKQIQNPNA